jgi:hypothetical protein
MRRRHPQRVGPDPVALRPVSPLQGKRAFGRQGDSRAHAPLQPVKPKALLTALHDDAVNPDNFDFYSIFAEQHYALFEAMGKPPPPTPATPLGRFQGA